MRNDEKSLHNVVYYVYDDTFAPKRLKMIFVSGQKLYGRKHTVPDAVYRIYRGIKTHRSKFYQVELSESTLYC